MPAVLLHEADDEFVQMWIVRQLLRDGDYGFSQRTEIPEIDDVFDFGRVEEKDEAGMETVRPVVCRDSVLNQSSRKTRLRGEKLGEVVDFNIDAQDFERFGVVAHDNLSVPLR